MTSYLIYSTVLYINDHKLFISMREAGNTHKCQNRKVPQNMISWDPHFEGIRGCRWSVMVPFERAMVVSYRL